MPRAGAQPLARRLRVPIPVSLAVPLVALVLLAATGLWARLALAPAPDAPLAHLAPEPAEARHPAPGAFFLPLPEPAQHAGLPAFARLDIDESPHAVMPRPVTPRSAPRAEATPPEPPSPAPGLLPGPAPSALASGPGQAAAPLIPVTLAPPATVPPARPLRRHGTEVPPAALLRSPVPPMRTAPPARTAPDQTALATAPNPCATPHLTRIPARPSGAPAGAAMADRLPDAAGPARDTAVTRALLAGNLPDFQRQLQPVTMTGPDGRGGQSRITLCVMPDYLALGTDADFLRVPMGLPAASRIAEAFAMMLPTPAMVDAIHAQARVRLTPSPIPPGPQMGSTGWFVRHNATLEGQRRQAGGRLGQLVSGHKKDLVLSPRLQRAAGRVAIYGWHRASGQPIQPLSTVHGAGYADYSHGVRLVSRQAFVNGQPADLRALLADPRHAAILSPDGPITDIVLAAARL